MAEDTTSKFRGKLNHKDKIAIIRDVIIAKPRYWAYGYNRAIIQLFKDKFGIRHSDSAMSKLKEEAIKQIETDKKIIIAKEKLIEMHMKIFEDAENPVDKTRSLYEIGKLSGHYVDKVEGEIDMKNLQVVFSDIGFKAKDGNKKD